MIVAVGDELRFAQCTTILHIDINVRRYAFLGSVSTGRGG